MNMNLHGRNNFLENGFWTPQTVMLRDIQDWVHNTAFTPKYALSIDSNPTLEAIFKHKWPELLIQRAVYPEVDASDLRLFHSDSFDLVFSHQVLEHIPKPWIAAKEMTRVLKPGGIGIHTTCAFNPRHGQPHFNDYYRFLKDGLAELFNGVTVLQNREWGNRQAILYNVSIDDGHGDLGGRRFHESIGSKNDDLYPWVTWIIIQKNERNNDIGLLQKAQISVDDKINCNEIPLNYESIILEDSHNIKFVLRNYEKRYADRLIDRSCDDDVFAAYQRILQSGNIVFDVGAHIGRYSVFPSRLIGPTGSVHSFEPVEDNYWQLKVTLALNRCENVIPVNCAIGDEVGEAVINLFDQEFSSWSSLGAPEMISPEGIVLKPSRKQKVLCDTIDNYCSKQNIKKIHFLKIDVEGFELAVLKGAEKMLQNHNVDYICFEISDSPLKAAGVSPDQIHSFLKNNGYNVYAIQSPSYKFIGPVNDLASFHNNYYASYVDLSNK